MNLAPHIGIGTPANHADGIYSPFDKLLHISEQPFSIVGHSLENGPYEIPPCGFQRLVEKSGSNRRVVYGCPFSIEPGRKNNLVASSRDLFHDPVKDLVDISRFCPCR